MLMIDENASYELLNIRSKSLAFEAIYTMQLVQRHLYCCNIMPLSGPDLCCISDMLCMLINRVWYSECIMQANHGDEYLK